MSKRKPRIGKKTKLPRDWGAIAAHFRRGGPMRHKNTPRGGDGPDPLVEEGLEEVEKEDGTHTPGPRDER